MTDDNGPVYLIDDCSHPPVLRIEGRASYLNCGPISKLFKVLIGKGKRELDIDFSECGGMDSTFLGILAGAALEYRRLEPAGAVRLLNLNKRNLQLIQNLGLHCILEICDEKQEACSSDGDYRAAAGSPANREQICAAHETLVEIDPNNAQQFKEVLQFLNGN